MLIDFHWDEAKKYFLQNRIKMAKSKKLRFSTPPYTQNHKTCIGDAHFHTAVLGILKFVLDIHPFTMLSLH